MHDPYYPIIVLYHGCSLARHLMLGLCFWSGEWCVNAGEYAQLGALNRTQFDALNTSTANAPRCNRLTHATCFRSRDTLGKAFVAAQAQDVKKLVSDSVQVGLLLSTLGMKCSDVLTLCMWPKDSYGMCAFVPCTGRSRCCCFWSGQNVFFHARNSQFDDCIFLGGGVSRGCCF